LPNIHYQNYQKLHESNLPLVYFAGALYGIIGFEDLRGGGEGVEIEIEIRMTG